MNKWIDDKFYENYSNNWDDELFRELILENVNESSSCLDFGAGRGRITQMHIKGLVSFVAGVDIDPSINENISVDEAKIIPHSGLIPYGDDTFDVVFSDNVMEHLENPSEALAEINRVLKSGGLFLAKTPNKYHYVPTIARITPLWFHRAYNKIRGRNYQDTFQTFYRCNSKKSVTNAALNTGFTVYSLNFIEGRPEYLRFFTPLYVIGLIYERVVNKLSFFTPVRCVLMFVLKKE